MATYRYTLDVAAPPEQVFDLWINLDRMHEWVEGVSKVTDITGPTVRVGTRYTVWFGPMKSPSEVLAVSRPHHYHSRFGNFYLRGENETTFEPIDGGTRVTEEFRTVGWLSAITSWIFSRGSYKGSFEGELRAFGRIAEREGRGRSGE